MGSDEESAGGGGGGRGGGGKTKEKEESLSSACSVCGSPAAAHLHYGAVSCYSCRAFFRRGQPKQVRSEDSFFKDLEMVLVSFFTIFDSF